ncbi:hypothetical protein W03_04040 [Nitrosomonas sp. PY1]|uniref:DUF488 domain-containing protein n=1 Tax=Nitrosomonas sp. PY1 TaxID=1803906 RepID=UPI00207F5050|nr:DUF488 domain-containing protein [Nitrosomonas sp. PY1]GKS68400.1 hypothetical protein W03_04040 [Nitrosomonas sp. PY1]
MNKDSIRTIYTIGHSTHTTDEFIAMLDSFGVQMIVDIRRFPSSRKYPNFDRSDLETSLKIANIGYRHIEALGGRRRVQPNSINDRWRNVSFRGYADYMATQEFEKGVKQLEEIGSEKVTAFMCAEAVWWRCHRSMVSDYLKAKGWKVMHIMRTGKAEEHPYTSPARIENKRVYYSNENFLSFHEE